MWHEQVTQARSDRAVNGWVKEANTKLGVARLDMGDTCTALESIMPLSLEFS
jgi:hypothetical protein